MPMIVDALVVRPLSGAKLRVLDRNDQRYQHSSLITSRIDLEREFERVEV